MFLKTQPKQQSTQVQLAKGQEKSDRLRAKSNREGNRNWLEKKIAGATHFESRGVRRKQRL